MHDDLIRQAQAGCPEARAALWQSNRRWVAAIVMAHRPRSEEVDDLMQDVAFKLMDKLHTLRDPGAFRPWLRQIILNVCRGAARNRRPVLRLGDGLDDGPNTVGPPASDAGLGAAERDRREIAASVLDRLATLPPEYREPLMLRCVRSMTYQQIGRLLDLPVTTVETRLARARRMLRDEFERREASTEPSKTRLNAPPPA